MKASSTRTGRKWSNFPLRGQTCSHENRAGTAVIMRDVLVVVFAGLWGRFLRVQTLIVVFWRTLRRLKPARLNSTTWRWSRSSTSENKSCSSNRWLQFPLFKCLNCFILHITFCIDYFVSSHRVSVFFSQAEFNRGGAAGSGSGTGFTAGVSGTAGAGAGGREGRCQEGTEVSGSQTHTWENRSQKNITQPLAAKKINYEGIAQAEDHFPAGEFSLLMAGQQLITCLVPGGSMCLKNYNITIWSELWSCIPSFVLVDEAVQRR